MREGGWAGHLGPAHPVSPARAWLPGEEVPHPPPHPRAEGRGQDGATRSCVCFHSLHADQEGRSLERRRIPPPPTWPGSQCRPSRDPVPKETCSGCGDTAGEAEVGTRVRESALGLVTAGWSSVCCVSTGAAASPLDKRIGSERLWDTPRVTQPAGTGGQALQAVPSPPAPPCHFWVPFPTEDRTPSLKGPWLCCHLQIDCKLLSPHCWWDATIALPHAVPSKPGAGTTAPSPWTAF